MKLKKQYYQVPLSDRTKEIILGTILGDGSLKKQKRYKNVRLQLRHSEKDSDYLFWKVEQLHEINGAKPVAKQGADGFASRHGKFRYISRALPALTKLYGLTYKHNQLRIRRRWLNHMTPLSLAVWWCDDGSLIGEGGRKGVICTDGFDKDSVKILAQYLDKVWNIRTKVAPVNRSRGSIREQYWRLWIQSPEELKKFLRIIIPHIPTRGMLRKVLLLYKDSQLQQRWISEVAALSEFSKDVILAEYEEKRKKWKKFR